MCAGCTRFCPATSALGVTGGFVTGAGVLEIQQNTFTAVWWIFHNLFLIQWIRFWVWRHLDPEWKFLLTGSYNHSLGSFGINWQSVRIKPCVDTNIWKNTVSINNCWKNVRFLWFFSTALTHFNECDHCIRQGRDASGGVFTVSLSTSADFCDDWENDKTHSIEKFLI